MEIKKEILKEENEKFDEVKCIIKNIICNNQKQIDSAEEQMSEIRKYMLENIELDMEEGDIDYDAIRNAERIHSINEYKELLKIKNERLRKIQNSPFFGRFDIRDDFGEEKFYIGLQNIQEKENVYVIDWRAPICSLYYNSPIGKTSYDVGERQFQTELTLKRQFEVEDGKITNFYDLNDNLNDTYLNKILQGRTSNYMSNIVKSVQKEQDKIIRLPLSNSVILQGVAGSGKTSIAMHRIAYLLYSNENLTHQNILFLSPSTMFTAYISHLLPELGEENVLCYSFFDVFTEQKLLDFQPQTRTGLLEEVLGGNQDLQKEIEKIFSVDYFDDLCKFLSDQVCVQDFEKLFPKATKQLVEKLFYVGEEGYNLNKRIKFIAERFADWLGYKKTKTEILTRKVLAYFENKFNTELLFEKFMATQGVKADKTANQDVATYVFIKMCVEGFCEDKEIKHVVVDEMQDYDFVCYKILTMLYPKATFTILGDIFQNLLTQNSNSLKKLQEIIKNSELQKLEISYRSTSNIFAYASKILGQKQSAARIIRQGDEPEEIACKNFDDLIEKINQKLKVAKDKKHKVAVLCQDALTAKNLANNLQGVDLMLSDTTVTALESEAILSTIYLCKGLEFDSVIIPIKKSEFNNPQNKQLLYVAITRALHNVTVCLY